MVTHAAPAGPLVTVDPRSCAAQECSYYTHYLKWRFPDRPRSTTRVGLSHESYHRLGADARAHFFRCCGSVSQQTPDCPTCERYVGRLRW